MITASSDFGAVTSAMRRELAQARKGEAAEGAKTLY
jgi:hypothetical protein